jgi:hypothetical protein
VLKYKHTVDGTPIRSLTRGSEKRVVLVCDRCGRESTTSYANYRAGCIRNGSKKTRCKRCATQLSGIAKRGKPIKGGPRPCVHGAKHHSWKGGRFVASDGYVQVYLGPKSYRKEHFLVMEKAIGRRLSRVEVVHHIDLDKQNSSLSNLVLLANESAHRAVHNSLDGVSRKLVRAGLIAFDRSRNRYVAVGKLRELLEQPEEANQQPSRSGDASEGSTTRRESL